MLRPGGWIVVELGFKMAGPVEEMFAGRWREAHTTPDLAGIPRVFAACYSP